MTKHFLLSIFIFSFAESLPQDSLKIIRIDSIVAANEVKVAKSFQKIEKNKTWQSHGMNPKNVTDYYKFAENNMLISSTYATYTASDTELIISLYFDSNNLIKAKTTHFYFDNKKSEFNYYYENSNLINKENEMAGMHRANFYVERAIRVRRELKKRPIKFPS